MRSWGFFLFMILSFGASILLQYYPDFHLTPFWALVSFGVALVVVVLLWIPTKKKGWEEFRNVGIWIGIFVVLIISYGFQHEIGIVAKRFQGALFPSYAVSHTDGSVTFQANADGHFYINAHLGKVPVKFLLDTGASSVVLTREDAKRLGVDPSKLYYDKVVNTANGTARAASVKIPRLRVGTIMVENVEAVVNESGLDISLLGMTFLGRLKSYEVVGPILTLRN